MFATSQLANVVFVLTEVSKFDEALKDVIQIKSFKLLWNRSLLFFIMLIRWLWLRRGNLLLKMSLHDNGVWLRRFIWHNFITEQNGY